MCMGFEKFLENGRSIILAYDHGVEHGPTDFNEKSVDPAFVMEVAEKGKFNGIALEKGLAEKYYNGKVPLILKEEDFLKQVKGVIDAGGVGVDETKAKLGGEHVFIWAARDVDTKEVLAFRASFTRSSLDAEIFLEQALECCENKPTFLVDKGPWYRDAFERLGPEYRHETPEGA